MSELIQLGQFPETKTEIAILTAQLIETAIGGEESPLRVQVQMSALEQVIKGVKDSKDFKDAVLSEAERYGTKTFNAFNSNVNIKEVGVKYDYSMCNHPQYDAVCAEVEKLTEQKKAFEKYLQAVGEPTQFINPETGEEVTIYPPVKTSSTAVTITINK